MYITDKDFKALKTIAISAGKAIMEIYNQTDRGIEYKKDDSPLTKADLASNKVINEGLKNLETQYPIVSEENDAWNNEERASLKTSWLIDPLDGTKEFISKNGEFAVCIALIHQGAPVIGLVYAPVKDELYYARKGSGAFLEINGLIQKLEVGEIDLKTKNLRFGVSRSHMNELNNAYIQQYEEPILVAKGSILKITDIALGNIDIHPRMDEKTKEWDIAAGQIILEEAGGKVINTITNEAVKYNKLSLQSPPFVALAKVI